ncbi:MAG: membrane protein insertase YidC, partial [Alphaproteobacteria bacterium]|nr:membrane protein insertase YidC [Alphaproteobacteria bacterium]
MEQRNLLIAIVLSVGILIGFQFFFQRLHPPVPHPSIEATSPGASPTSPAARSGAPTATTPGAAAAKATETVAQAIAGTPRVDIATPSLRGSIALIGAKFDDLRLAKYRETVNPQSPEVLLLSPSGTANPYLAEFGWVPADAGKVKVPGPDTVWKPSGGALAPSHPITLTWDNGEGLVFSRTISIDQDYMFTVHQEVHNTGTSPVQLLPYGLISRTGTPEVAGYYILFEGLIGYLDGSLQEVKYSSLTPGQPNDYTSTGGWLGFTDKYWLTALIPSQSEPVKANFTHALENGVNRYQTDYLGPAITVAPNASQGTTTRFFAGAKEVDLLDSYAASGIPRFDRAIDFGWFYFLTKPIFLILQFFDRLLGNFGLAILLLTLCVKLLFFPLANKSYQAMSKMKLLQPEIQKLRERFPDDKARQQQEMMALYKRVGANPLAGCLPIVIQIPVFFSLYKVLFVTIEMRHAPFFGWIHDLSAPDPTSFANLFGLLPYAPPAFLMIGAWPLIMGVTMFLQQKLNPQPVDPVQARMFMALPVVFTYMLSAFPAGLVIYWAWNNTLSIAQQYVIMRRHGAEIDLWGNIVNSFRRPS